MVEFQGVSKVYTRAAGGRVEVLADTTFQIDSGEMAVVSGPSGAGKTTLLRLVWGEERPSRGAVLVAGANVGTLSGGELARLRRRLAVVPQDRRLLADRTVFGNVAFVLRALGVPRSQVRTRTLEALREAGVTAKLTALPPELAQGERQRLLLARALATAPHLLLVDEPTDMLDDVAAGEVLALLRAVQARGSTVLVATHVPDVAKRLGGRSLVLEGGRVRVEGGAG
jgi:cell division transport system ATP-binding protein